jgi:ATP-dependent Lon protease
MISALTGIPVKKNVAMTGEITLRGRVLPIGGLKEKVLAAHRAGINTIIVPMDNKKDIDDIPENVRKKIKFVIASEMETVINTALAKTNFKRMKNKMADKLSAEIIAEDQAAVTSLEKGIINIEQ